MRAAARTFGWIGLFACTAGVVFAISSSSGKDDIQGILILLVFAAACLFLALLLGRQGSYELDGLAAEQPVPQPADEIHLPGPSIFPALYGGAALLLVLGLVLNPALIVLGVLGLAGATLGWAVESVREYRREVAHARPVVGGHPKAIAAALQVQRFSRAHGGADAVVQHVGRGGSQIVLVGRDGQWGNYAVRGLDRGREACRLAGVPVHDGWPREMSGRVRGDADLWARMAGRRPHPAPGPRDPATQTGARLFRAIGLFAVATAAVFAFASSDIADLQGVFILLAFGAANFYLAVFLRNARGGSEDLRFADETGVAVEPTEPPVLDPATMHLPGPSIWPAMYGVAGLTLTLGLVLSPLWLWLALVLFVAASVGWGVESVREYRAGLAGGHGTGTGTAAHERLTDGERATSG